MQHLDNFLSRLRRVRQTRTGWRACCPAHNDREPSLGISLGEANRILFNCMICGRAKKDKILEEMGLTWRDTFARGRDQYLPALPQVDRNIIVLTLEQADQRNAAYAFLAGRTKLLPQHVEELERRGLDRGHIHSDGYFSVEEVSQNDLGRLLLDMGDSLYDVPGFWSDVAGKPRFARRGGLFIPVRDECRRIINGQVRSDEAPKYLWLSGGGSPRHVPLYVIPGETVWVTEGPLKADIASNLGGLPVVGVAGVGTWGALMPALRRWGTKRVVTAFDADWQEKQPVYEQLCRFERSLAKAGFEVDRAEWQLSVAKGLDDLLQKRLCPVLTEVSRGKAEQRQGGTARA